jgi:prepilin-type N-terminal cleavage/methylation domain-containing protein
MRVKKAFTLIEITIVLLLLGVLYSLVLSNYTKKISPKAQSIEDLTNFTKKSGYANGTFYIYGDMCDNGMFIDKNDTKHKTPYFNYPKDSAIMARDISEKFSQIRFDDIRVNKKNEKVCLELVYKNYRFLAKYILSASGKYYLFMPFWQKIKRFSSLEKAKELYIENALYPQNEDDFYHE